MVDTPKVGIYRATGEIPALCCSAIVHLGEIVTVIKYTSKNRLLISRYDCNLSGSQFHKVARSTFRMNVEEIEVVDK